MRESTIVTSAAPTTIRTSVRLKADAVCLDAADTARDAAIDEAGPGQVGEHLGHVVEGERVVTHLFACTHPGYVGWRWAVTVTRASRAKVVTINEVVLLPGDEAVVAPEWVPWSDRLQPGDLRPGDLLPTLTDDPRLTAGFTDTGAPDDVRSVVDELGLGRSRVLSPEGRESAAERWHAAEYGPESPIAQAAAYKCESCGYWIRLADSLGKAFGACANEMAPGEGRVVAVDYGCGAHSDVSLDSPEPAAAEYAMDTIAYDDMRLPKTETETETGTPEEPNTETPEEPSAEASEEPKAESTEVPTAESIEEADVSAEFEEVATAEESQGEVGDVGEVGEVKVEEGQLGSEG